MEESTLMGAMFACGAATLFGVLVTGISVLLIGDYGASLFVGTPVVVGTIAGWRVNRPTYRGLSPAQAKA